MKLRIRVVSCLIAVTSCLTSPFLSAAPAYNKVVLVILENHSYSEVANPTVTLPYINNTLRPQSADMTAAYGMQHPSQPNYYWLFSGSNQSITTDSPIQGQAGYPFTTSNLYQTLTAKGLTFSGFVDAYPGATNLIPANGEAFVPGNIGNATGNTSQLTYASRHVPWLGFSGIPASVTMSMSVFQGYAAAGNFSGLSSFNIIIPALENDMHDYGSDQEVSNPANSQIAMQHSDQWLQANIAPYVAWAKQNNSLLILTTDEDSSADWGTPLTPAGLITPPADQITTLFAGANIVAGQYPETALHGINHVNVLRTIEAIFGLTASGAQDSEATSAGLGESAISDIFAPSVYVAYANYEYAQAGMFFGQNDQSNGYLAYAYYYYFLYLQELQTNPNASQTSANLRNYYDNLAIVYFINYAAQGNLPAAYAWYNYIRSFGPPAS